MMSSLDRPLDIVELRSDEVDGIFGGVPWVVIPLVALATHLASEIYHHHIEKS